MKTSLFFLIMALSSGVTLLRGFAVAAILVPEAFGSYATIVATGAFLGIFMSFGSVEATWKQFPRQWAVGRRSEVVSQSRKVDLVLVARGLALMIVVVILAWSIGTWDGATIIVAVCAFALAAAVISSGSSFLRASGDLTALGIGTLLRTTTAIGFAVAGAWLYSWPGAVAGELIGAMLFIAYVEFCRRQSRDGDVDSIQPAEAISQPASGGLALYVAGLLVAIPLYLDRLFVREVMGAETVGTYGFLMLFNVGAATVIGIVVQKVGPQIIKLGATNDDRSVPLVHAWTWIGRVAGTILLAMILGGLLILIGPAQPLAAKYGITWQLMAALSALCITHAFILLDWVLMERGQERIVLLNAFAFLAVVCFFAVGVLWFGASILMVIVLLTTARLLQVGLQVLAVTYR